MNFTPPIQSAILTTSDFNVLLHAVVVAQHGTHLVLVEMQSYNLTVRTARTAQEIKFAV